jgi:hypothetical protein
MYTCGLDIEGVLGHQNNMCDNKGNNPAGTADCYELAFL